MKKLQNILMIAGLTFAFSNFNNATAQCTWQNIVSDGFEYSTPCPDVLPGVVYTTVPQTWIAHSGTRSLYLNFVNCAGGAGTCAGDTVYRRTFSICPNTAVRVSAWFVTTFAGPTSNMKLLVVDANNNVLANLDSLACPNLTWVQYQSGSVTPATATFSFVMITNKDGGNGNDLSVDDLLVEKCVSTVSLGSDSTVCNTDVVTLDAGSGFSSYLWSNGLTTQTIQASTTWPGSINLTYSVIVTDSSGCNYTDTIKISFLDCTGLNSLDGNNQFTIYPNPATDNVTIASEKLFTGSYFILTDITGREIQRIKIESKQQQVSLNQLRNGVYFYQISDGANLNEIGKIKVSGHTD